MSRQSTTRQARRDLRRHGCTCHPTITHIGQATARANGARAGGFIRHERGCRLGDQVARLNQRGVLPALFTYTSRCGR